MRIFWLDDSFVSGEGLEREPKPRLDSLEHDYFIAKECAGFKNHSATNTWRGDADALEKLRRVKLKLSTDLYVEPCAQEEYRKAGKLLLSAYEESFAITSDLEVPAPIGINPLTNKPYAYMDFQRAGISYALKRKDTIIGDEPGVGKTMQAIGFVNSLHNATDILVVCPAFLKLMWRDKFKEWDVKGLSVGVASGVKDRDVPQTDVVIINYDIAYAYRDILRSRKWQVKIVDEAHKIKNEDTRRAKEVFGINAERNLYLTGTPALNGRPYELWPLISQLDPNGLGKDEVKFGVDYCKLGQMVQGPTGEKRYVRFFADERKRPNERLVCWITNGVNTTALPELHKYLRERFMVRRTKSDVMPQLPKKRRLVIPCEVAGVDVSRLAKEIKSFEKYTGRPANALWENVEFGQSATEMLEAGRMMIEPAVETIKEDLAEMAVKKIVVMCFHKEVAREIAAKLNPLTTLLITGDVDVEKRYPLAQKFQSDSRIETLVGTINSCSEGLEMYAASEMVFPERTWVVGEITQAEDRIHRQGQTQSCLYKHLVLEGSLQEKQTLALITKQEYADSMLDRRAA